MSVSAMTIEDGWAQCERCSGLFRWTAAQTACPAGAGGHVRNAAAADRYFPFLGSLGDPTKTQDGWRGCAKYALHHDGAEGHVQFTASQMNLALSAGGELTLLLRLTLGPFAFTRILKVGNAPSKADVMAFIAAAAAMAALKAPDPTVPDRPVVAFDTAADVIVACSAPT